MAMLSFGERKYDTWTRLGIDAPCVDTATYQHLTSPARLGAAGFLVVRTGEIDKGPSRGISLNGT